MPEIVGQSWQQAFRPDAAQAQAARAWVTARTRHNAAAQITGELVVAVLAAHPSVMQVTLSTAGPRTRITAGGDRPLPTHALHGPGRQIICALAVGHGAGPDGCSVWADLTWETP